MTTLPASRYLDPAGQPWEQRRPGVHWKVLWRDVDRQTVLVRYDPGATVPRRRHLGEEQIFVLENSVSDDTGTCSAGQFARRPPGCVHTVESLHGALVLAIMSGSTEPVAAGAALAVS